jgi:hypothetical protein
MSRIPVTQEDMKERDRVAYLEGRVAGYQEIVAEKTEIIEQLQKENAELHDKVFDLECKVGTLHLEDPRGDT